MSAASCDQRKDPVARMVRDMTAEEMVDWMVKYHGLPEGSRDTVVSNLREQYRWHRLQGRLDRTPTVQLLAQMLAMRQSSQALATPPRTPAP